LTRPTVERLTGEHRLDSFDSGSPALDEWLRKYARQSERVDSCLTYVAHVHGEVVAYHSLVVGSIERATAPAKLTKGMPRYPIPVILLARLAVDHRCQGRGYGAAMLRDALVRSVNAADIAAAKAVVVDAKDGAASFYQRYGFESFPDEPSRLYVSMATLRAEATRG
jgi:predicted N-acetyltransferase YhbS